MHICPIECLALMYFVSEYILTLFYSPSPHYTNRLERPLAVVGGNKSSIHWSVPFRQAPHHDHMAVQFARERQNWLLELTPRDPTVLSGDSDIRSWAEAWLSRYHRPAIEIHLRAIQRPEQRYCHGYRLGRRSCSCSGSAGPIGKRRILWFLQWKNCRQGCSSLTPRGIGWNSKPGRIGWHVIHGFSWFWACRWDGRNWLLLLSWAS